MNNIIPHGDDKDFIKATKRLINIDDYQEFRAAADNITIKWPGCKVWLDWWIFYKSAKKLFRAVSKMPQENSQKLPNSTNAQESMHHFLYMAADKNQNILTGKLDLLILNFL